MYMYNDINCFYRNETNDITDYGVIGTTVHIADTGYIKNRD